MQDHHLRQAEYFLAIAHAAQRDLSEAAGVSVAEFTVSGLREAELLQALHAGTAEVDRARDMLARARLDGDPELLALVQAHERRKTTEHRALFDRTRAELVQIKRAQLDSCVNLALRRWLLDTATDAASPP